jgi:hypothetical protein
MNFELFGDHDPLWLRNPISEAEKRPSTFSSFHRPRPVAHVSLSGWRNLVALCNDTTYLETHGPVARRCFVPLGKKEREYRTEPSRREQPKWSGVKS